MSVLRHRAAGRASVSVLVLAVVAALSVLTQGLGAADGSSDASGHGSLAQASSEFGVVPATRASLGSSELEREERTGSGPLALLLVGAAVFTLIACGVRLPSADRRAVQRVVGPNLARAPPVTPAV